MGLDMYLYAIPKIDGMGLTDILSAEVRLGKLEKEEPALYQKIMGHMKHFEEFDYTWDSLRTEVAYWRKANQIHNWFVENVQNGEDDCDTYEVKQSHLVLLSSYCRMILSCLAHPAEVLPTKPGFFFGSTEYDSFYFHEILETYKKIENLIETISFDENYLVYQSSW